MATLSEKDQRTLLFWKIARVDVRRPRRWVESLKRTIDTLASSPTEEAAALFWIRLHGVLHQLPEQYQPPNATARPVSSDPHEQQSNEEAEYLDGLAVEVLAACMTLRDEFSRNELLVIQWKRDHEAHPQLGAYDLREQNGQLKKDGKHAITGNVDHADVHAAVRALAKGRGDVAIAVDLALRAAPHVDQLLAALAEFPDQ